MEKVSELRTKAKKLPQLLQQVESVPGVGNVAERERDVRRKRERSAASKTVMVPSCEDPAHRKRLEADDEAWLRWNFTEARKAADCELLIFEGLFAWHAAQEEIPFVTPAGEQLIADITLIDQGWKEDSWNIQPVQQFCGQEGSTISFLRKANPMIGVLLIRPTFRLATTGTLPSAAVIRS